MKTINDIESVLPDKYMKTHYTKYDFLALSDYFVSKYDFKLAWDVIVLARNIDFDTSTEEDITFWSLYNGMLYNLIGHQISIKMNIVCMNL